MPMQVHLKADSHNANTSVFYICMPERSNYGYAASNVVATMVIINGPVLRISQKVHQANYFGESA